MFKLPKYSKNQFKHLMKAGAIKINTKKIFDPNYVLKVNDIVKIGKRIIFKVK